MRDTRRLISLFFFFFHPFLSIFYPCSLFPFSFEGKRPDEADDNVGDELADVVVFFLPPTREMVREEDGESEN